MYDDEFVGAQVTVVARQQNVCGQEIVACTVDPSGDEVIVAVDANRISLWRQSGDGRFPEGLSFSASEARSIAAWLCAAAARQESSARC